MTKKARVEWHGHRGCRGLLPENSIPAFLKAIDLGMDYLEMDVVISADEQVVIAHEPYMPADICLRPDGSAILKEEEKSLNLFKMSYAEIAQYDCGCKHPRFPDQKPISTHRPLLRELFETADAYCRGNGIPPIGFTIELKSHPDYDGIYHPAPERFVGLVLEQIEEHDLSGRCVLQSFDLRVLQEIHTRTPEIKVSLLLSEQFDLEEAIDGLGYTPTIIGPHFELVDKELIKAASRLGIKVVPWTINEVDDMQRLIALGVNGIITDYPDRKAFIVD